MVGEITISAFAVQTVITHCAEFDTMLPEQSDVQGKYCDIHSSLSILSISFIMDLGVPMESGRTRGHLCSAKCRHERPSFATRLREAVFSPVAVPNLLLSWGICI